MSEGERVEDHLSVVAPDTAHARGNGGGRARVSASMANEYPAFRQSARGGAARALLACRHVAILFQDRLCPRPAALDAGMHPAAVVVLLRDPFPAPEPLRDLPPDEPCPPRFPALAEVRCPRRPPSPPRPRDRGAEPDILDARHLADQQEPAILWKHRPDRQPDCTDRRWRSILSIRAPSPSRSPESVAPPSATSRASGGASGATRPSITPACVQNGASGRSACGSSKAAMPQAAAARSAAVWRHTGNGARSGRPERWRRFAQASL